MTFISQHDNNFFIPYQDKIQHVNELPIPDLIINQLENIICLNNLKTVLHCNNNTNITLITNITLSEYFKKHSIPKENKLEFHCSGDIHLNSFKQTVEIFCKQTSTIRHKVLVLHNLDDLPETYQESIISYMDAYTHISVISSCHEMNKVSSRLTSRFQIIHNVTHDSSKIDEYFNALLSLNKIKISDCAKYHILKITNYCFDSIENSVHKLKLIGKNEYSLEDVKELCGVIDTNLFDVFTKHCLQKRYNDACQIIHIVLNKGYPVIDFLELYFAHIKTCHDIDDELKTVVITVISKYITHFYLIQENSMDFYFFTFELISELESYQNIK